MIGTIARKELLTSVLTFRFGIGLVLCVVAAAAGTLAMLEDYSYRAAAYARAVAEYEERLEAVEDSDGMGPKVYGELARQIQVFRPPPRLGVFSIGSDRWQGNQAAVGHDQYPVRGQWLGSANPYLAVFRSIDLSLVVQLVMGLLALLFAYDALAGEKEEGTLKMMVANALPRDAILLGKAIGHLAVLTALLLTGFLASLLIAGLGGVGLDAAGYGKIGMLFLTSLLYVAAVYFIGLLLSGMTHRAATALLLAMFTWIGGVVALPNAAAYAVDRLIPVDGLQKNAEQAEADLRARFRDEEKRLVKKHTGKEALNEVFGGGYRTVSGGIAGSVSGYFRTPESVAEATAAFRKHGMELPAYIQADPPEEIERRVRLLGVYFGEREPLAIDYAEQAAQGWMLVEARLKEAMAWQQRIGLLSPAGAYAAAASGLAGTGREAYWRFLEEARQHRRQLIAHFEEEGYFTAREWYNDQARPIDLDGLPRFQARPPTVWEGVQQAGTGMGVLLGYAFAAFGLAYWRFRRYDVR